MEIKPSFDELIKPFKPYMKRFGFMYIHFNNETCLMANDLHELINETWDKDPLNYSKNITEWCEENIVGTKK